MGRPRAFDIEQAIAAATKLFWRGYHETSLTDLTSALGIAPASFYFAFTSKEALFRQVVDRYIAFQDEAFERAFQASTTGAGVDALLRGYADVVTDPEHASGCLVINSSPSTDAGDALRQWLAGHRETLRIRLQDRFSADVTAGKLPDNVDPKAMARFIVTLAGGLAVEARSGADRQDLYAMIDVALASFAGRGRRPRSVGDAAGRPVGPARQKPTRQGSLA